MVEPSTQKIFIDLVELTEKRVNSYLQLVLKKAGTPIHIRRSANKHVPDDRRIIVERIHKTLDILGIKTVGKYVYRIQVKK